MYATTRIRVKGQSKPAPVKTTTVLFDASRRQRPPATFGRGLATGRYAGQHSAMPYTADDDRWATSLLNTGKTLAELDAAEDRYNEVIEQAAFEDACLQRYTRGFCL